MHGSTERRLQLHQTFTQIHLQRWVPCIACLKEGDTSLPSLLANIYGTGRDILFNADAIKSLSEPSYLKTLFAAIPMSEASLQALPKLLQSFASASRRHKALFGQETSALAAARTAAMVFYAHCADYIRGAPAKLLDISHLSRLALLRVVEEESLLGLGQTDGQQAIRREVDLCISGLPLNDSCQFFLGVIVSGNLTPRSRRGLRSPPRCPCRRIAS